MADYSPPAHFACALNKSWLRVENKKIEIADLPALKNLVTAAANQATSF